MSILIDFSIFPVDKGESVSLYVAKMVAIIKKSGLSYTLGSMGTTIEGDWNKIIVVIDECFKTLQKESNRIYMTIKADYRKVGADRITSKIKSIEEKI